MGVLSRGLLSFDTLHEGANAAKHHWTSKLGDDGKRWNMLSETISRLFCCMREQLSGTIAWNNIGKSQTHIGRGSRGGTRRAQT